MKNTYLHLAFAICAFTFVVYVNAQCPTARDSLDVNQVNAFLLNGGDMFWDLNSPRYEVPKGSGINAIGPTALWMGAVDDQGQLKVAAQTYRQSGSDFQSGPIDLNVESQEELCTLYDRFWKVSASDILSFREAFSNGAINSIDDVAQSIRQWPGKNSSHGDFPTGNLVVAPFVDIDGDGNYDPLSGDYPDILGDAAVWWVYNDRKEHNLTYGEAMNIQVSVMAYAFEEHPLEYTTFYKYDFLNAGTETLNNFRTGLWSNYELGCYYNNFVGSVPDENLIFVYQANTDDCGFGYGSSLPILGIKLIEGLKNPSEEEIGFTSFMIYIGGFEVTGQPSSDQTYYNYLQARWLDDTPLTFGGDGYGGTQEANFMFPSNPSINGTVAEGIWSECASGNESYSRRGVVSTGGITLEPGGSNSMTIGIVWDDNNTSICPDISEFSTHVNAVKNEHDQRLQEVASGIESNAFEESLHLFPNPMQSTMTIEWSEAIGQPNTIEIINATGQIQLRKEITDNNRCHINRASLSTGIYFLKLLRGDRVLAVQKFVVK